MKWTSRLDSEAKQLLAAQKDSGTKLPGTSQVGHENALALGSSSQLVSLGISGKAALGQNTCCWVASRSVLRQRFSVIGSRNSTQFTKVVKPCKTRDSQPTNLLPLYRQTALIRLSSQTDTVCTRQKQHICKECNYLPPAIHWSTHSSFFQSCKHANYPARLSPVASPKS